MVVGQHDAQKNFKTQKTALKIRVYENLSTSAAPIGDAKH
jgi:hypothetical protein